MNDKKSNIFKSILLLVFAMVSAFLCIGTTFAAETKITQNYVSGFFHAHQNSSTSFSRYGQMASWSTSAGITSYCIEPGATFSSNSTYVTYAHNDENILSIINDNTTNNANKINQEQLDQIKLIANYGYGYQDHNTLAYRMATQMLIWRVVDPDQVFTNLNCTVHDCRAISDAEAGVADEMAEIMELVANHNSRPSFNGNTINMNLGETITLNDEKNVLSNYSVSSCENCTATINGNSLQLTATGIGNFVVRLSKNTKANYNETMVFAVSSNSQNQVVSGSIDPIISTLGGTINGGSVEVHKVDELGNALKDVTFKVYNSSNQEVCTIVTDSNGFGNCSNLSLGNYTIREVSTPNGYVLDDTIYSFSITSANSNIEFNFENLLICGNVELYKVSESEDTDATLDGAIYGLYDLNNNLIAELKVDSNGYAKYENLKYGDYYLKELKASIGHEIDTNIYHFSIHSNNETIKITSVEPVIKYNFSLIKTMGDGSSGVIETEANATFDIYLASTGKKVASITTGSDGKASIKLNYGVYNVCQTAGNPNTLLADCFEIDLTNNDVEKIVNNEYIKAKLKVYKIDSITGESINISGIQFKIKNLDTGEYVCQTTNVKQCVFTTDEHGILITPLSLIAGRYQLEEVDQKLDGYLWNDEPLIFTISSDNIIYDDTYGAIVEVSFANTPVFGEIIINKAYEDLAENLPTTTFGIYANEDIYYNNQLIYHQHDLVAEISTDSNGYAKISNLYLADYYIKELATDDMYVLDEELYYVSLEYQDQYTATVVYEFSIENELKRGNLMILKADADTNESLSGAVFSIYDMNDELVYTGTTDEFGKLELTNLKYGKYYLIEEQAPDGYVLNNEKYYFEITEDGQVIELEIKNSPILGNVIILKVDSDTDELLSGAVFSIYNINDELIYTGTTDEFGKLEITDLKYGEYYLVEEQAPEGYVLNNEKYYFEISENDSVIEITISNNQIIEVPKTGLSDSKILNVAGIVVILLGVGYIVYDKFKKR